MPKRKARKILLKRTKPKTQKPKTEKIEKPKTEKIEKPNIQKIETYVTKDEPFTVSFRF